MGGTGLISVPDQGEASNGVIKSIFFNKILDNLHIIGGPQVSEETLKSGLR